MNWIARSIDNAKLVLTSFRGRHFPVIVRHCTSRQCGVVGGRPSLQSHQQRFMHSIPQDAVKIICLCLFYAVLVVPIYVDVVAVVIVALNRKIVSTKSNTRPNAKQVQALSDAVHQVTLAVMMAGSKAGRTTILLA